MTLKSSYDPSENYIKGDVVPYQGAGYVAKGPVTGIPPTVDRCWRRLDQDLWDVVDMILDAFDLVNSRISEDAIVLKGAGEEPKEYVITVDESGEEPELAVTEVEEEVGE